MAESQQPIATPPAQRVEEFRRRVLPPLVWSLALLICVALLFNRVNRFEYIGVARALEYEVSANSTGTLQTVLVDLYDIIEAGDMLAKLDDAPVIAALETADASIRQLTAEIGAAKGQVFGDKAAWVADLRRFQIDEESQRLDVIALRVAIESDEIEALRLALDVQRNKPLFEDGIISESQFDNIALQHERVQTRIDGNKVLLSQAEEESRVARVRRQEYETDFPAAVGQTSTLRPLREAIAVETQRVNEIELQRQALVLRSPVAGRVNQLLCRRGQAVIPGEPIMMIVEHAPREILAYLREADADAARESTRVLVSSRTSPEKVVESLIVRVGPAIEALPRRLWRDPRTPSYGRAVVIAGVPALDLTPGELVNIRLLTGD